MFSPALVLNHNGILPFENQRKRHTYVPRKMYAHVHIHSEVHNPCETTRRGPGHTALLLSVPGTGVPGGQLFPLSNICNEQLGSVDINFNNVIN